MAVVPAGQPGSLVQASDARVDFLFCLAGFQSWTPSGQMKVARFVVISGGSNLVSPSLPSSLSLSPFSEQRTAYAADILIID